MSDPRVTWFDRTRPEKGVPNSIAAFIRLTGRDLLGRGKPPRCLFVAYSIYVDIDANRHAGNKLLAPTFCCLSRC